MKKIFAIIISVAMLGSVSVSADVASEQRSFLKDVHDYVLRCAVQPYAVDSNGKKVFSVLKSICPELVVNGPSAAFALNGVNYVASIHDSDTSDGGDLNDLFIKDETGSVIVEIPYILAFGDVLLAMAGGDDGFAQEYDPEILTAVDTGYGEADELPATR